MLFARQQAPRLQHRLPALCAHCSVPVRDGRRGQKQSKVEGIARQCSFLGLISGGRSCKLLPDDFVNWKKGREFSKRCELTPKPGIQLDATFFMFPCDDHLAILTQMSTYTLTYHCPTQVPQLLAHVVMCLAVSRSVL